MLWRARWFGVVAGGLIALLFLSDLRAEDALAFVTEVEGAAVVDRADGTSDAAAVGSQLFDGDEIRTTKGKTVLIYLSGRSVEVKPGAPHKVQEGTDKPSVLVERLMNTLDEMVASQKELDRPLVQAMARSLPGLTGALPANTRISRNDFDFTWDALEEAEEYLFTLKSEDGQVLARRTVKGTRLSGRSLNLLAGARYCWNVEEADAFLPTRSDTACVHIAVKEEVNELSESLGEIEKNYRGATRSLLKATTYYREGYYYEAERALLELEGRGELSPTMEKMLTLLYAKMKRWERLPAPEE